MTISHLKVSNFKSFKNIDVELGKFNVLIGANASGKSNFVDIFRFLRDIAQQGLDNAVSIQGGVEYLRNIGIGSSEDLSFSLVCRRELGFAAPVGKRLIGLKMKEIVYEFTLHFEDGSDRYEVSKDQATLKCDWVELERSAKEIKEKEQLGSGNIVISNIRGDVKYDFDIPKNLPIKKEDLLPKFLVSDLSSPRRLSKQDLLLQTPLIIPFPMRESFLSNISIFDFDPKVLKKVIEIGGKRELEENGRNLAIVLKNIIGNKDKKAKFLALMKDVLPFVDDLEVLKFADKSLLLTMREKYTSEQFLPAPLVSDGTMNIAALIIALYFEEKRYVVVEEPERSIHPFLISKVVGMFKEAASKKQIIVTTHNPEMVKHADVENILLVSRDEGGFSLVRRPNEIEEVKAFLRNQIGIEELYISNLLGV